MAGITCKPDGIDEGTKIKSQNLVIESTSVKISGISPTVGRVLTCSNVDGSTQWVAPGASVGGMQTYTPTITSFPIVFTIQYLVGVYWTVGTTTKVKIQGTVSTNGASPSNTVEFSIPSGTRPGGFAASRKLGSCTSLNNDEYYQIQSIPVPVSTVIGSEIAQCDIIFDDTKFTTFTLGFVYTSTT